jgi:hypothetical protein
MSMRKWQMSVCKRRSLFANSFLENRKFAHYDTIKERHSDKWLVKFGGRQFWPYCVRMGNKNSRNSTINVRTVSINVRTVFYC